MVLDWGLSHGPSALEASTLSLGYQGGSITMIEYNEINLK